MNNRLIIGAVLVVMIILLGLSIYKSKNKVENFETEKTESANTEVQRPVETINAKYQYKNGQNVFVVALQLPTPCHSFSHTVTKSNEIYEINLNTKASQEVCAQVVTERLVKLQWAGKSDDSYIVKLNDEVVSLNVFTIPSNEDIDKIEVYTKG